MVAVILLPLVCEAMDDVLKAAEWSVGNNKTPVWMMMGV